MRRKSRYMLEIHYLRTYEKTADWLLSRLGGAKPIAWHIAGPEASARVQMRLSDEETKYLRNAASWEGILSITLTRK